MTYACEHCGFIFSRAYEAEKCPFCEKNQIRFATKEEDQILHTLLEQGKPTLQSKEEKTK